MKFLSKEKISNRRYKTPEGYLVCLDAIIARTGSQDYTKAEIFRDSDDDTIVKLYRPEKEVFSPQTMASFENKPFVDEHPDEDVNVDNHRDYAIGFVRDVRRATIDGEDVLIANLVVTDAEAIAEIESGEKVELSCGYDCDILGEEPNLYQANIRGNHVALCKAGRAGIARIQDSQVEDVNIQNRKTRLLKTFKQYNYNRDDAISEVNNIRNITEDEIAELTDWIYTIYKDFYTLKDSVKDSAEDDFYDELFSSNIKYEFVKGGYGIKFKTPRDYQKAKEIAKRTHYTKGKWYDKDLEFFEYGGITISNEDSIKESKYSYLLKDLSPEERLAKIDELIEDEEEAIVGYKEAMKYANEADKSIYAHIIAEELEHITELKTLRAENFEKNDMADAGTTRRMFRESEVGDENSWFGTTEWGTPKGNMYIYKKNGKIIAEGSSSGWSGNALQKGEKKEFNSVKELNKWLNTPIEDSIKDVRTLSISGWEYRDNDFSKELNELKQLFNSNNIKEGRNKLNKLLSIARDCLDQIDNATSHLNGERKDYYKNIISQLMDLRKQHNLKDGEESMKDSKINYKGYDIEEVTKLSDKTKRYQFSTSDGDVLTFKSMEEAKSYIDKNLTDSEEIIDNGNVEVEDKLIAVEESYINELKRDIQKMGFKVVSVKKYLGGEVHFQILSNEGDMDNADLKYYAEQLDRIDDKFERYKIPMTYNIGLQYDGYISAGIDLRQQWVKDSIKDTHFTVSSNRISEEFNSEEELLKKYKAEGYDTVRGIKAPKLKGLYGPFFNGDGKILYETKERYMSNDSCKDEAIYKWMADPEDEQDLIDEAKKLGCQLQKIGYLIQVTGPISKLAKVLGETEESIIKASQQRMSTIKKVKDVDTYKEVTQELEKETKKLDSAKVLKLINIAKKAKVVKDSNLGKSKLKIGQKVHLDPTKNSRASKEALEATYEVVGFWYQGKLVTQDPVTNQEYLDMSGVLIKNVSNGVKSSVNRFQLMDSKVKDSKQYSITYEVRQPGQSPFKETVEFNALEQFDKYLANNQIGTDYALIHSIVSKNGLNYKGNPTKWTEARKQVYKQILRLDSCKDDMELSAKTSEALDELMKQYQKKHPTWKFGEIRKEKGLYRCSVIKDSKVKDIKNYEVRKLSAKQLLVLKENCLKSIKEEKPGFETAKETLVKVEKEIKRRGIEDSKVKDDSESQYLNKAIEYLKKNPPKWQKGEWGNYLTGTQIDKITKKFLKYIGYKGNENDFYWEKRINIGTIILKALDLYKKQ